MEKTLTMRENRRLQVIQEVMVGRMGVKEASEEIGVSERQVYRMLGRVRAEGAFGIAHGNRGRPSPFRIPEEVRERVIRLYKGPYWGFNGRHFADELKETEDLEIGRESVRKILRGAGIAPVRRVKRRRHRRCRAPMERFGEMLQGDAWTAPRQLERFPSVMTKRTCQV